MTAPDPKVVALLARLTDCLECEGTGESVHFETYEGVQTFGPCQVCAPIAQAVADHLTSEADARVAAVAASVLALHPVEMTVRCGNRLAEPVNPPPGPPAPPIWCARPTDGHGVDECTTYSGQRLAGYVRGDLDIEEREPVTSYRCTACNVSGPNPAPCPTRAAVESTDAPAALARVKAEAERGDLRAAVESAGERDARQQGQGFWDGLGVDHETGMPVHLPMGLNADGQGPEDDSKAMRYGCWCGRECPLHKELQLAAQAGTRSGPAALARVKAEAWNEGHGTTCDGITSSLDGCERHNPYREAGGQDG